MKIYENGIYRDLTVEELAAAEKQRRLAQIEENSRPLTESEVSRMLITQQINTLTVDDNTALRMLEFYPSWESMVGKTLGTDQTDFKVGHGGKLWRVITPGYTFQSQWTPGSEGTESVFAEVCETHEGTLDDPIPYSGNMALTTGLYYIQNYVIYLCIRDTVNPVYNALTELIGIYVEEV